MSWGVNTIKDSNISDRHYRKYMRSKSWECPEGGSHFWIPLSGITWQCKKCLAERDFALPSGSWNQPEPVGPMPVESFLR